MAQSAPKIQSLPAWVLALALLTLVLYWPATRCAFVNCDDPEYVYENAHVQAGLTAENFSWVFSKPVLSNWHPLTMLSYMADRQFFGAQPWGFHLTNILLHTLNTALVFLVLRRLTGVSWRSWLVAALFGLHPLHVESVAWVAERKDVLSAFFWLLALWAYAEYARHSAFKDQRQKAWLWFGATLGLSALGLMCKAMLVTMPCVLLLLDFWPLGRFLTVRIGKLLVEKIPFFALSAVFCIVTFVVQKNGGAMSAVENYPAGACAGNALVAYCRYLGKIFLPTSLAAYYPHPGYWPLEQVLLAGAVLAAISWLFYSHRARRPYLLTGWLWFLGTLVPVIGLVQVGEQSMADRYTYMPALGIFVIVIWGAHEFAAVWRFRMLAAVVAAATGMACCFALTRQQISYWQDSETLFRHTTAVTENNPLAENDLGLAVLNKGKFDEAIGHFQEAARLKPYAAEIRNNLGLAFLNKGQTSDAIEEFQSAIRLKPWFVNGHMNLGFTWFSNGNLDGAISEFKEAISLDPNNLDAKINLGIILLKKGGNMEAVRLYQEILNVRPDDANSHYNLGLAFLDQRLADEAISEFQIVLRLNPNFTDAQEQLKTATALKHKLDSLSNEPVALNNLAWALATNPNTHDRNGPLAVRLAEHACERTQYQITVLVGTLAAAYAEAGRFDEAVATAQKACALAKQHGEMESLKRNEELLTLYQARQPYHEPRSETLSK